MATNKKQKKQQDYTRKFLGHLLTPGYLTNNLVLRHTDIAMFGDLSILGMIKQTQGVLDAQEIHCQTQI
jgi:hypothetical protein